MKDLIVATMTFVNDEIYYTAKNGPGLYKYNVVNRISSYIDSFCDSKSNTDLYCYSFIWEEKLFFVPKSEINAAFYSLKDGIISYDLEYNDAFEFLKSRELQSPQFLNYYIIGNNVYFLGYFGDPFMYEINMDTKEGREIKTVNELNDKRLYLERPFWTGNNCSIPSFYDKSYYTIDVTTGSCERKFVDCEELIGFAKKDSMIFALYKDGKMLRDIMSDEDGFLLTNTEDWKNEIAYAYMDIIGNTLILVSQPTSSYQIVGYDIENRKQIGVIEKKSNNEHIYPVDKNKNTLLLYSETYNEFLLVNERMENYRYRVVMEDGVPVEYTPYIPNGFLEEGTIYDFRDFIDYVV